MLSKCLKTQVFQDTANMKMHSIPITSGPLSTPTSKTIKIYLLAASNFHSIAHLMQFTTSFLQCPWHKLLFRIVIPVEDGKKNQNAIRFQRLLVVTNGNRHGIYWCTQMAIPFVGDVEPWSVAWYICRGGNCWPQKPMVPATDWDQRCDFQSIDSLYPLLNGHELGVCPVGGTLDNIIIVGYINPRSCCLTCPVVFPKPSFWWLQTGRLDDM